MLLIQLLSQFSRGNRRTTEHLSQVGWGGSGDGRATNLPSTSKTMVVLDERWIIRTNLTAISRSRVWTLGFATDRVHLDKRFICLRSSRGHTVMLRYYRDRTLQSEVSSNQLQIRDVSFFLCTLSSGALRRCAFTKVSCSSSAGQAAASEIFRKVKARVPIENWHREYKTSDAHNQPWPRTLLTPQAQNRQFRHSRRCRWTSRLELENVRSRGASENSCRS
jgi:hypothetical protein